MSTTPYVVHRSDNNDRPASIFESTEKEDANLPRSIETQAEAMVLAQQADPGVKLFSRRGLALLGCLATALICGSDAGFDNNAMSAVNTMRTFLEYYGFAQAAPTTGILFGMYTIGGVSAFPINASLPDLVGRKRSMMICNTILAVGLALCAGSQNFGMFLAGRYLMGLGAISASASARSYIVEIAPVRYRGLMLGSYNVIQLCGGVLVSGLAIPFGKMKSEWGWRGIFVVGLYGPVINIFGSFFCPESPRWLFNRGHEKEALAVLARLHSQNNDPNSPLVQLEMQEMAEVAAHTGSAEKWWDFRRLFNAQPNRWRVGLAAMIGISGQTLGPSSAYFAVLLLVAGVKSLARQRVLNLANRQVDAFLRGLRLMFSIVTAASALGGAYLSDHVGRKPLTLFGTGAAAASMFLIGGLLSHQKHPEYATAGIVFIFLYGVFCQGAWAPINNLYPAEIMSFDIRAKGLALQALCTQASSLINTFAVPPALLKLNWKTYFIFGAWDMIGLAIQWLFMVETAQVSLEQMENIFEASWPPTAAATIKRARKAQQGRSSQEMGAL